MPLGLGKHALQAVNIHQKGVLVNAPGVRYCREVGCTTLMLWCSESHRSVRPWYSGVGRRMMHRQLAAILMKVRPEQDLHALAEVAEREEFFDKIGSMQNCDNINLFKVEILWVILLPTSPSGQFISSA